MTKPRSLEGCERVCDGPYVGQVCTTTFEERAEAACVGAAEGEEYAASSAPKPCLPSVIFSRDRGVLSGSRSGRSVRAIVEDPDASEDRFLMAAIKMTASAFLVYSGTMNRKFSCYARHMVDSIKEANPGWTSRGSAKNDVEDFFKMIVMKRQRERFDVHGSQGKNWQPGDSIEFIDQKTKIRYAQATLDLCVEGAHVDADPKTERHFFLKDIGF